MHLAMSWFGDRGGLEQNRATVDALAPPAEGAVLEVGFGSGHALSLLAEKVRLRLVAGVDRSPRRVEAAWRRLTRRRRGAAVDLRVGDAARLPFPDEAFDLALAVNAYPHWAEPEDGLAEMAGVLKPGGELVLSIRDFRAKGQAEPAGAGEAAAKAAAATMALLGLKVSMQEIIHSVERATYLVRGLKAA